MHTVKTQGKRRGRASAGSWLIAPVLVLTACVPPGPGSPATATATVTGTATATATASPDSTPAPDPGETAAPKSGDRVISSKVARDWGLPGEGKPFGVEHNEPSTLKPPYDPAAHCLVAIAAAEHLSESPPYDQLSFRFRDSFPSYTIEPVSELIADASGFLIPMPGVSEILRVTFHGTGSRANSGSGASTVKTAPREQIGYKALTSYKAAGDFEGVLSYGIGVGRPAKNIPQTKVRIYEVEKIEQGQHVFVVAIQLDATNWK